MTPREPEETIPDVVTALLAPIPGPRATGEWLRYEGTHERIAEAQREDDPTLPQGVWKTAIKQADWHEVSRLCSDALTRRSKDLQIAGWLLEAWIEMHGLDGLNRGLRLVHGLCDRYWDLLHPRGDGDPTARLSVIEWIDRKIAPRVKRITLLRDEQGAALNLSHWEGALALKRPVNGKPDPTAITVDRFTALASLMPSAVFAGQLAATNAALATTAACEATLALRVPGEAGGLRGLRRALTELQALLTQLRGPEASPPAVEPAPIADEAVFAPDDASNPPPATTPIRSRAEAYQRLAEVAEYLLRSEPHSPTAYLIKRAIAWGNLPLDQLLAQLVQNPQELKAIFALLDIRP